MSEKKNIIKNAKEKISKETIKLVDENGNGKIDLEDFVVKALRIPGVHVNRSEYLSNAFKKYCDAQTIEKAIATTPVKAGISRSIADKAANDSISLQKTLATATSIGLGATPGGVTVDLTTTVADLGQFYGHLLVIMQKLMYIYGYPELDLTKDEGGIDDGTMNLIIISIGTMAGVEVAGKFLNKMAEMLAMSVPKKLLKGVLAEKVAFQVSKEVLNYFGIRLTRDLATKGLGNGIKFFGGVIVGGITLITFNTSCSNFQKEISDTPLSNPNYVDKSNVFEAKYTTVEEVENEFENSIQITDESNILN